MARLKTRVSTQEKLNMVIQEIQDKKSELKELESEKDNLIKQYEDEEMKAMYSLLKEKNISKDEFFKMISDIKEPTSTKEVSKTK